MAEQAVKAELPEGVVIKKRYRNPFIPSDELIIRMAMQPEGLMPIPPDMTHYADRDQLIRLLEYFRVLLRLPKIRAQERAIKTGRWKRKPYPESGKKISLVEVAEIMLLTQDGRTMRELAEYYAVNRHTIRRCLRVRSQRVTAKHLAAARERLAPKQPAQPLQ